MARVSRSGSRVGGLKAFLRDRSGIGIGIGVGERLVGLSGGRECLLRRETISGSRVRRSGHDVSRRDAGFGWRGERFEPSRTRVFLLHRDRVVVGVLQVAGVRSAKVRGVRIGKRRNEGEKVARGGGKMVMRVRRRCARIRMSVILGKARIRMGAILEKARLRLRGRQSLWKSREDARLVADLLDGGRELEAAFSWRARSCSQRSDQYTSGSTTHIGSHIRERLVDAMRFVKSTLGSSRMAGASADAGSVFCCSGSPSEAASVAFKRASRAREPDRNLGR